MEMVLVMALKPFLLLLLLCIAWPFKRLVETRMKDGWLKRLLLTRHDRGREGNGR